MKRMIKRVFLFVMGASIFTSCETVTEMQTEKANNTISKKEFDKTTPLFVMENGIFQKPLVADLDVKKQRVKMVKVYEKTDKETAKNFAKGDFMVQEKCDVIVEPYLFTNTIADENGIVSTTVTLTGYPANYTNIKNYDRADEASFRLPATVN